MKPSFQYAGLVRSVYDADTIRVDIDLGMSIWIRNEPLRLARINAPEVRGDEREAGIEAREYLREAVDGHEVVVTTDRDKKGKYGRYVCELWVKDAQGEWINMNDRLVAAGHAQYKHY
jgi:micrococcal nuclease